ncbi:hypothetical protein [Wenzhouxiangella sp. 15181]|uniref:hypothetical protein n=2 Tax=unclassified Wenzhouxiangella TaxID=2613841 RepID=UPI001C6DDAD4|nr:hypothetical protein [Wenzhouxiangella sp. 15181]
MASTLIPAQLFIFNITTIVVGNEQYLSSSLPGLVGGSFLPFLVVSTALYLISRALVDEDQENMIWFVLPAGFFLLWIQSQLLVWDYGGLTGASIDWRGSSWRGLVDAVIWIAVVLTVFLLRSRIRSNLFRLATAIALLQFVVSLYSITGDILSRSNSLSKDKGLESIREFSQDQNVIHLIIDGFQSDILEELLENEPYGSRYAEKFQGFTFFRENISVFPYTQFSVPTYLSTEIYRNKQQKEQFIDGALSGNTIISEAKKNGFKVDLAVNGPYFTKRHSALPHDNIVDIDEVALGNSLLRDLTLTWDMSLFRSVPHFVKPLIHNQQKWLFYRFTFDDVRNKFDYFLHTEFLNRLSKSVVVESGRPVYKLIHVGHTHRPMILNQRCEYAGRILPDTRVTLAIQSACTMDRVIEFLDRLRQVGIYESSLIVIHSDHGGWVPTLRDGYKIPLGDGQAPDSAASLASALLMVKPPGAQGSLETSNNLTSLINIPDTISEVMKFDVSFGHDSVFNIREQDPPTRKHMFYLWHRDEWENDFTQPIVEYTIQGSHFESEWQESNIYVSREGLRLN